MRLARWLQAACETDADAEPLEACTVDGKTVYASFDAERGVPRTHIFSTRLTNGLVVGPTAVPDKSNAWTAIRQLLPALELEGRVVSIDALACQTDITQTIDEEHGWYLLAVKDNQSDLYANLQRDFAYLDRTGTMGHDHSGTVERGHGCIEWRTCILMGGTHGLQDELDPDRRWAALGCAVRYYITNLSMDIRAARVADLVRGHWGSRTACTGCWTTPSRWTAATLRTGHAARNRAALRHIALNFLTLMQQYFQPKMSIRQLRKMVARNPAQLEPIMAL